MTDEAALVKWLLQGDPAIRWRVIRDLRGGEPAQVALGRERMAFHGWGRRLLAEQDPDGRWGGG